MKKLFWKNRGGSDPTPPRRWRVKTENEYNVSKTHGRLTAGCPHLGTAAGGRGCDATAVGWERPRKSAVTRRFQPARLGSARPGERQARSPFIRYAERELGDTIIRPTDTVSWSKQLTVSTHRYCGYNTTHRYWSSQVWYVDLGRWNDKNEWLD